MTRIAPLLLSIPVLLCLLAAGCDRGTPRAQRSSGSTENTNQRTFEVKGVVIEVEREDSRVRIRHEEIPGYMAAMTMPFDVRDTNELAGLEPGDVVQFRMIVTELDGWIDRIRKTGESVEIASSGPPTTGEFRLTREVEPLNEGDPLPEYNFTNQFGRAFSTKDFQGRALAIEFLFTRCPYPTFCPLVARNFRETQDKLKSMSGAPTNWHLLTISFDPEFDTPAVLKAYAESHQYDPARWTFATGALIDITAIAEQTGLTFWRDPGAGFNHNLRTVVVDPAGRVQRIIPGNEWTSDELAAEMVKAARVK